MPFPAAAITSAGLVAGWGAMILVFGWITNRFTLSQGASMMLALALYAFLVWLSALGGDAVNTAWPWRQSADPFMDPYWDADLYR